MKDFIAAAQGDRKEGAPSAVSLYCLVLSKFNSCQLSKERYLKGPSPFSQDRQ